MSLLVPNVGEVELLSRLLNKSATGDVILRLFTNDKTPAETDVVGDYTEASATGYAAKTLTGSSWTVASDGGGTTEGSYAQQSFDFTAAVTCYGYYVTNAAGAILLWAERFSDGPYTIPSGGGSVRVTPKIQLA